MNLKCLKLVSLLLFLSSFTAVNAQQECLKNAWKAYNAGKYLNAITYCDQCMQDFGKKAARMQASLEAQGRKNIDFPTGSVSDAMKAKIFKNWAINDVSTACFLKGRSAENLYKKNKAKNKVYKGIATEAFNEACNYSFGRCWDKAGWFWSPCAEAKDRLPIE